MPYIVKKDRKKFEEIITKTVNEIMTGSEPVNTKGELFAYFVNRMIRNYIQLEDYKNHYFNSHSFNEDRLRHLISFSDGAANLMNRHEPLKAAGEINYVISSIYWGILGDAENIDTAGYGFRTYLRGFLEEINNTLSIPMRGNNREVAMMFRRYITIRGVINDIIDEAYNQKTRPYEDQKIQENSTLWEAGELISE